MKSNSHEMVKLLIADDEWNICELFENIIQFEDIGLSLIGTARDGVELCEMIEEKKPDIIITDICMPKKDGLQVIQQCRNNQNNCRFIVISGYRQFEYAYNALKYNVSDYLLKPINEDELNQVLRRLASEIRKEKKGEKLPDKDEVIKNYFLENVLDGDNVGNLTDEYSELNKTYSLKLRSGYFLFFYLKLDDRRENRQLDEQLTSILKKLNRLVRKYLQDACYEILIQERFDALKVLINYDRREESVIEKRLEELFLEGRTITDIFNGLNLTICVGDPFQQLNRAAVAGKTAWTVLFSRLGLGTNQIIYYRQLKEPDIGDKLVRWEKAIIRSWETLDTKLFQATIEEMFLQPQTEMCSYAFATFIPQIKEIADTKKSHFVKQHDVTLQNLDKQEVLSVINLSVTFEECKEALIQYNCDEIKMLEELVDKKNIRPIRMACEYVQQNIQGNIKMEDVAALVNLSPAYFSSLFTKKMNQTFSDYIIMVRIKKACGYLENSDMKINEIALAVGLNDVRYFSKLFRKKIGIKPTEYRKIYG